ncbi:MAG TPA: hypothetical protein VII03_04715 [Solirubrobacteraceae bacterium]
MRTTPIAAVASTLLLTALGAFASTGVAQPLAHTSSCKAGKEAQGCRLTLGGFGYLRANAFVSFLPAHAPKGSATTFSMASQSICAAAAGSELTIKTRQTPTVGGTLSFAGNAKLQSTGESTVGAKSAKVSLKVKISSAKQARLTGKVEALLANGSKCVKSFANPMVRILGG